MFFSWQAIFVGFWDDNVIRFNYGCSIIRWYSFEGYYDIRQKYTYSI